jgi:hypothetical protein
MVANLRFFLHTPSMEKNMITDKLTQFFSLEKEIHEFFGYTEDWVKIPLEDCRDVFWKINGTEQDGEVLFHEEMEAVGDETGQHYSYEIYTQRFLPKWVYRTETLTMISCDTRCDGNKFLCIFDNTKEIS